MSIVLSFFLAFLRNQIKAAKVIKTNERKIAKMDAKRCLDKIHRKIIISKE